VVLKRRVSPPPRRFGASLFLELLDGEITIYARRMFIGNRRTSGFRDLRQGGDFVCMDILVFVC